MSGAPKNISRDGHYFDLDDTAHVTFSSDRANTADDFIVNCSTTVNVDIGYVQGTNDAATSVAASSRKAIGLLMQAPIGDRTPYRVKARCAAGSGHTGWMIGIGYAPASPTGSDDAIDECVFLPFDKEFDELVVIEAEGSGDTYEGRALCFAIVCQAPSGGVGDYMFAQLSVQNLGVKPPTMQNAVS